jgi:Spy/CpxP family protein refolding chaperone
MKKSIKILGVLMLTSVFALPALAERPLGKRGKHRKHKSGAMMNLKLLERAADQINLDESTLEAIKEKVYQGQKKSIALQAKLKSQKLDLHRELDSANPNRGTVMDLIEDVGELQTKLKKHRVGMMLDVRSMLTPAQVKQLKKLKREFKSKKMRRRGDRKYRAGDRSFDRRDREE